MDRAGLVVLALALAGAAVGRGRVLRQPASQILIAAIFAVSLNLLVGYGGLPSLGHASYLGMAAYVSALAVAQVRARPLGHRACGARRDDADGVRLRLDRAARHGARLPDDHARALAGAVGARLPLGIGDERRQRDLQPHPTRAVRHQPRERAGVLLLRADRHRRVDLADGAVRLVAIRRRPQRRARPAAPHGRARSDVWLVRWLTFVYAGFWGAVSGLLYVYYNKYIHPTSLSITSSAEALLGVIAGGAGTLGGPIVGAGIVLILKNYASAYIERWNMLLGFVFLAIVLFMPDGVVPGLRRAWVRLRGDKAMTPRARDRRPLQVLRRAPGDESRHAERPAGRAPPDHRAERCGQDDALQSDHRRLPAGLGNGPAVRARHHAARASPARASGLSRALTRSSRCSPRTRWSTTSHSRCSA